MPINSQVNLSDDLPDVPQNAMLGEMAFMNKDNVVFELPAAIPVLPPNLMSFYQSPSVTNKGVFIQYTDTSGNARYGVVPTTPLHNTANVLPLARSIKNLIIYNNNNTDASGNINTNLITIKFDEAILVNFIGMDGIKIADDGSGTRATMTFNIDLTVSGNNGGVVGSLNRTNSVYYIYLAFDHTTKAPYVFAYAGLDGIGLRDINAPYAIIGMLFLSDLNQADGKPYAAPFYQSGQYVKFPFYNNGTIVHGATNISNVTDNGGLIFPNTNFSNTAAGTVVTSNYIRLNDSNGLGPAVNKVTLGVLAAANTNVSVQASPYTTNTDLAFELTHTVPDLAVSASDTLRFKKADILVTKSGGDIKILADGLYNLYILGFEFPVQ